MINPVWMLCHGACYVLEVTQVSCHSKDITSEMILKLHTGV